MKNTFKLTKIALASSSSQILNPFHDTLDYDSLIEIIESQNPIELV